MERGLLCRTSLWGKKSIFWVFSVLLCISGGEGEMSRAHPTLSVLATHLNYICPEGATVQMVCAQKGAALHHGDVLKHAWLYTPHREQQCTGRTGPRNIIVGGHYHGNHSLPAGLTFGSSELNFWVVLQNLTQADQGRYCCMVLDIEKGHKHGTIVQRPHSHITLKVTPRSNGSQNCTVQDPSPTGGFAPVAGAIAAFILTLLLLPLIMVLVYKQRQSSHSSRRAQELVRMDSEALGHENPVFLGGSPQIKTRTVSQIMTRQSSETGRHLLSEPGTPLSPPAHGDVFFPIEDTIFETQDFMQV
ncbi:hypothetical protein CesoFtcFv8_020732 [Champsocephalus esox]|uniref:Ig-like domain-containing protein n=1 Tax=Champsocephalus esox TaxID=159716 RepID=A0AAN8GLF8_9TELE|nr:hypothetical protein CesoFtcFv8_020732 [Champsocephalus esox]